LAFNISGAAPVPLSVFGSWVTEVAPESVPENISPDNQEIVYAPGSVGSRPAFQSVSGITFPAVDGVIPTGVYGKSFVTPTLDIHNLYFDSAGRLWVEDFTNDPNVITLLLQSTPGSFCRSITLDGREYIAISDGLHGADMPLQYDGINLDRVTMNGPGLPPTVTSLALPAVQMIGAGNTLTRSNNTVTVQTETPHGLKVGYQAQISNVPDSNATTVNQSNASGNETPEAGFWALSGSQFRSGFSSSTSPLSAFFTGGYGFNIPAAATILGVIIEFGINSQSATTGTIAQVSLWESGAQLGTAKSPGTAITTTITPQSFGSSADMWGAALTPAIINNGTFGFAVSCTLDTVRVFLNFPFQITVFYTLSGSGTVAEVTSIVINNETFPGLALVTTSAPNGLIPGINVSIVGVEPAAVADVSAATWSAGTTTITTATNHSLTPGAVIQVGAVTTATGSTTFSFNGTFTVQQVPSPNQLMYAQAPITATDPDLITATVNTGNITVSWPIPDDTPTPTYFQVDSCPTPTTFYIEVDYADGTWSSGTVGFIWEGTFYVTAVESPTEFTYFQPGPNGATSAVGTVTPFGQAAPGLHLCQVLWLTRQGAIPAPSPFFTFIANGGQYVQITGIPIGPSNVNGRILAFTGAQPDVPGEIPPFFYIPTTPQLEGQIVGTATQINDNTTTSITLDFSDNTLFAAIGISIPGNTLANQIVLDGALGFRTYLSRLETFGQRNVIQNLLNMGFEGGFTNVAAFPGFNLPCGWASTTEGVATGTLVNGARFPSDVVWQVTLGTTAVEAGFLAQSAFEDCYGDPIFVGDQTYSIRFWAQGNGAPLASPATVTFEITSASTGFSSTAAVVLSTSTAGQFYEANFSTRLPVAVPSDLVFQFFVGGTSTSSGNPFIVDLNELQVIFAETPFLDTESYASYVNNFEGIDGTTGIWGPEDTAKIMDMANIRGTQYIVTQAPTGKLHETTGSAVSEPSGWTVNPVAAECGLLSAFALTVSQADDASEAAGGDWMAWASDVGAMIFGGGLPEKISQEIQPNWNDPAITNSGVQINMAAATSIWALNDPVSRLLMFGLPIGTATAPSQIYPLNYQHLGTAEMIAGSPPFHPSFSGKLIATDNSRKWTHWLRPMNGAARMYRSAGQLSNVFFGGNGQMLGAASGFGHIYTLNPALLTDSDFGIITPSYTTYAFLDPATAQALQLKGGRILLAYLMAYIQGTGNITATYFADSLENQWPLTTTRQMTPIFRDREFGGGNITANRIFIKFSSSPIVGTDNSFALSRLTAFFKDAKMKISGSNQ
jgi:hypothetical protein